MRIKGAGLLGSCRIVGVDACLDNIGARVVPDIRARGGLLHCGALEDCCSFDSLVQRVPGSYLLLGSDYAQRPWLGMISFGGSPARIHC